jgi:phosphate transport system substrate-binding protein
LAALILLAFLPLSACRSGAKSGIVVAGSTSVEPYAEILAEEYMILNPGISIDIQGGGSAAGIMAAQSGTADIGMSSRALKGTELSLTTIEIAIDGLAVVVHPSNPILDLTTEQLRDIYAARFTNWNEVGGRNAKIHVITREDGSGTRGAFESFLMGDSSITSKAIVQDSNGAVRQLVKDDPNAIGYISLGLVNDSVKALELDGVAAARENVLNRSYKLSRPFLFLTNGPPAGFAKRFIDFILSEEGQLLLSNEGLIPVTEGSGT